MGLELASDCDATRQLAFQHDDIIATPQRDQSNTAALRFIVVDVYLLVFVRVVLLLIRARAGAFLAAGRLAYPGPKKSLGFGRAEVLRKLCGISMGMGPSRQANGASLPKVKAPLL